MTFLTSQLFSGEQNGYVRPVNTLVRRALIDIQ